MGLFLFLIGLSVGSFLNGLAFRATSGKAIFSARSTCFGCNEKIKWYDLIPLVNWFILRGKCRNCETKIPLRYPLVELFIGIFTYWFFKEMGITIAVVMHYLFVMSFFLNVLTDITDFMVYDPFLGMMVLFSLAYVGLTGDFFVSLMRGVFFLMIMGGVSYGVSLVVKKQSMGSGDYFVFFCLGMILQPESLLELLLFSSLFGLCVALILKKNKLPFFPLLFFGYLFLLLGGV